MWAGRWWIVGLSLFYNHYSGWSVKGSVRRIEEDPKAEMKYYISILYQRVIVLHHRDSTAAQRAQTNTDFREDFHVPWSQSAVSLLDATQSYTLDL